MPRRRFITLACSLLLAVTGLLIPAGPANASSTVSVRPAVLRPGDTFTVDFTATRDFVSGQAGMGIYASVGPLGTLDSFTTLVSCYGSVAGPCETLDGLGYRAPTGPFPVFTTVSGSLTLRVNPGTPAGSFGVRHQFGGDPTVTGPTVTVLAPLTPFTGFFYPVDNQPAVNWMRAGRAVPLRFSLGGDRGLDIVADGYPVSTRAECRRGTAVKVVERAVRAASGGLTYDAASDRYTYVMRTNWAWRNTCRTVDLQLTDGSHHLASFAFK